MNKRRYIKTTKQEIIDYWKNKVHEFELSVDWNEAMDRCWRCGCIKKLDRCHIIPHALGGEDAPSNLVLLCKRCHGEGPNVSDKEIMWDWIKSYEIPFYDKFWFAKGMREYKFIYNKSIIEEIKDILLLANIEVTDELVISTFKRVKLYIENEASIHFGQRYFNTATIAGLLRMHIKKIADFYNVSLPPKQTIELPWYLS